MGHGSHAVTTAFLKMVKEPDVYPFPIVMDFMTRVTGCTFSSKIDVRKG
jgi:hypothetical protein